MNTALIFALLIPFLGTIFGASFVFFLKEELNPRVKKIITGFAAGVIISVSIWSLLVPSEKASAYMGNLSFIPPVTGFILGFLFLMITDTIIPHIHPASNDDEGIKTNLSRSIKLALAVALHNLPEGIALGIVCAGWLSGHEVVTAAAALTFSIGLAIQNMPEGAIVSIPLKNSGLSKLKSFNYGAISGAVEPIGAIITIFAASLILPALPYLLSFAAGAMFYVTIEELIPEMTKGKHNHTGAISFAIGFAIMIICDIVLA